MGIVPCDMQILCRDVSFILLIIVKAAELKKWSENENRAEIEQNFLVLILELMLCSSVEKVTKRKKKNCIEEMASAIKNPPQCREIETTATAMATGTATDMAAEETTNLLVFEYITPNENEQDSAVAKKWHNTGDPQY